MGDLASVLGWGPPRGDGTPPQPLTQRGCESRAPGRGDSGGSGTHVEEGSGVSLGAQPLPDVTLSSMGTQQLLAVSVHCPAVTRSLA